MPILKNNRHERFAQFIAKGKTFDESYQLAGFKPNRHNASRLNTDETIKARVIELLEAAAARTVIDKAWIMERLALNVELALARDKEGKPLATYSGAVANQGLKLLGLEFGMFKEKIDLGGKVQIANTELFRKLTPDERQALRGMLVTASSRVPSPANENEDGGVDEKDAGVA